VNRTLDLEVADFLFHEADLLDQARWHEWLALFDDDGTYWVPSRHGQTDPLGEVSLFHEDKDLLAMRIGRLVHPAAHGLASPLRTSRLIGNVRVTAEADGGVTSTARFHLLEYQGGRHRAFAGSLRHRLRHGAQGWRIREKRVDLVDVDHAHAMIQILF
jgi:benzoate/toluate 1,2-dioxygenase beta subunit